ncbi:SdrD B-like domain-containing protein [Thiothrix lacustris]|uniref:SdrD B-like domain-containing protein n=1 Tax=Thiothrix lacustris TaxID=525917 RepID=A0ABY9MUS6_9GAMM|nr:SdrD B-like domain-containing protein [Thiothrix lacustris]WML91531.1 SdrD B-like domain-containing protein [Thiothrix lacustris]
MGQKMYKKSSIWRYGQVGVGVILLSSPAVYADISGKVFRDFNANGALDVGANFNEVGMAGITVKAFDAVSASPIATATSGSDGSYNLSGLNAATHYRLEFSWADTWLKPGTSGGSSVQFADDGAVDVNLAVNNAEDYCEANPLVVIPRLDAGSGVGNTHPALFSFPYDSTGGQLTGDGKENNTSNIHATIDELGSVYGVGWQRDKRRIFISSYLHRNIGFADGPGYVYAFDFTGSPTTYSAKFDLQGVTPANGGAAIDLGSVTRSTVSGAISAGATGDTQLSDNPTQPQRDLDGYANVSKVSFGDAEVSEDNKTLWLVNLKQRALISVDISGASLPGAVNQYPILSQSGVPTCSGGEFRPFALTFHDGKGYLGGVCDASSSQSKQDLQGKVLAFDPQNVTAGFVAVLNIPLDTDRGFADSADSSADNYYNWNPWIDTWSVPPLVKINTYDHVYPNPLLSDLQFLPNGSLVIGFRDRWGDMMTKGYKAISGNTQIATSFSWGDMMMACNVNGTLHLEGDNTDLYCPGKFEFVSNNWQYFSDYSGDSNPEGTSGALAYLPGSTDIITTMLDPQPPTNNGVYHAEYALTHGIHKNNINTGAQTDWHQLLDQDYTNTHKSNSLGDIELLCSEAPIQVGNRVWLDADSDGIQDAGEAGLDGVKVDLICGTEKASMTTANGGQYLFSNASGGNATFMAAGANCHIEVDNTQTLLKDYSLTTANADAVIDNNAVTDLRDSDAVDNAGKADITFTVAGAGENNHTLDIGYKVAPVNTDLKLEKISDKSDAKRGDTVVYTLTLTNESDVDATGVKVEDNLPTGMTLSTTTAPVASKGAFVAGVWDVGTLQAKSVATLSLTVTID